MFRLSVTQISVVRVPSFGSWSSAVCLACKGELWTWTCEHCASQQSFPSHKACVSRENGVCVHMCVLRFGWLTATSFAYSHPLPSVLFFSVCLSLSLHRHRKSTAERERAREKLADQGLVVTQASRLSISPPLPPDRVLAAGQGLACKPASHISP